MTTFIATCRIERRVEGVPVVTNKGEEIKLTEDEQGTIPASAIALPKEAARDEAADAAALAEKEAADKAASEAAEKEAAEAAEKEAAEKEAADKAADTKKTAKGGGKPAGSDL